MASTLDTGWFSIKEVDYYSNMVLTFYDDNYPNGFQNGVLLRVHG